MTVNLTLVLVAAALLGCGVYLVLERSLSRVLIGIVMIGNGVSLCFMVAGGPAGRAPIVTKGGDTSGLTDPLPQAMVLTAIVISLGTVAFMLALANRSRQLDRDDDVTDDPEDRRITSKAAADDLSGSDHVGADDESGESAPARLPRRGTHPGAARAGRDAGEVR